MALEGKSDFYIYEPTNKMWSYVRQIALALNKPLPHKTFKAAHAYIQANAGVYKHLCYGSKRRRRKLH